MQIHVQTFISTAYGTPTQMHMDSAASLRMEHTYVLTCVPRYADEDKVANIRPREGYGALTCRLWPIWYSRRWRMNGGTGLLWLGGKRVKT